MIKRRLELANLPFGKWHLSIKQASALALRALEETLTFMFDSGDIKWVLREEAL